MLDHLCRQPLIEKTRFRISQNGNIWEVDKFEKENDGLVIAELETSKGKARSSVFPPGSARKFQTMIGIIMRTSSNILIQSGIRAVKSPIRSIIRKPARTWPTV